MKRFAFGLSAPPKGVKVFGTAAVCPRSLLARHTCPQFDFTEIFVMLKHYPQLQCSYVDFHPAAGRLNNEIRDQRTVFQSCDTCILYASVREITVCTCRCTDCSKTCVLEKFLFIVTLMNSS